MESTEIKNPSHVGMGSYKILQYFRTVTQIIWFWLWTQVNQTRSNYQLVPKKER